MILSPHLQDVMFDSRSNLVTVKIMKYCLLYLGFSVSLVTSPAILAQNGHSPFGPTNSDIHRQLTELQDQVRQTYPSAIIDSGYYPQGPTSADLHREVTGLGDQLRWHQTLEQNQRRHRDLTELGERSRQLQFTGLGRLPSPGGFGGSMPGGSGLNLSNQMQAINAANAAQLQDYAVQDAERKNEDAEYIRENRHTFITGVQNLDPSSDDFEKDLSAIDVRAYVIPGIKSMIEHKTRQRQTHLSAMRKTQALLLKEQKEMLKIAKEMSSNNYYAVKKMIDSGESHDTIMSAMLIMADKHQANIEQEKALALIQQEQAQEQAAKARREAIAREKVESEVLARQAAESLKLRSIGLNNLLWMNADESDDMRIKFTLKNDNNYPISNVKVEFKFHNILGEELEGGKTRVFNNVLGIGEQKKYKDFHLGDYPNNTMKVVGIIVSASEAGDE